MSEAFARIVVVILIIIMAELIGVGLLLGVMMR